MYCLSIRTSIHFLIMLILGLNLALDWLITCKRKTYFICYFYLQQLLMLQKTNKQNPQKLTKCSQAKFSLLLNTELYKAKTVNLQQPKHPCTLVSEHLNWLFNSLVQFDCILTDFFQFSCLINLSWEKWIFNLKLT